MAVAVVVSVLPLPAGAACFSEATFESPTVVEQRGDVAAVQIDHCGLQPRSVVIAGDGFNASVSVYDGSGDDVITLLVNTYAYGPDGFDTANPNDDVEVNYVRGSEGPLETGEYDLDVIQRTYPGLDREDNATLVVEERSLADLTVLAAPGDAKRRLRTPRKIRTRIARDVVSDRTPFPDDIAVFVLRASGLAGALSVQPGEDATDRFLSLADGRAFSFQVRQTAGSVPEDRQRAALDLQSGATRVVPDGANDTYYVLVDIEQVPTRAIGGADAVDDTIVNATFRASVTVPATSPLSAGREENVSTVLSTTRRTVDIRRDSGRSPYLRPGRNLTVSVTTNVRPGRTIDLRLFGARPDEEFQARGRSLEVPESGRVTATFPTSHLPNETELDLQVEFRGRLLEGGRLRLEVADPSESVAVSLQDQSVGSSDAETAVVERVVLSRPGFVAIHRDGPNGTLLGVSNYLPAGSYTEVEVPMNTSSVSAGEVPVAAVVYHDGDGDDRFAGPGAGDPRAGSGTVAARATLDVQSRPTPTTGTTETPGGSTPTTPPGDDGDGLPIPGFGAAAAVAAVLAALALGRRS